jgi:hypothetical protein
MPRLLDGTIEERFLHCASRRVHPAEHPGQAGNERGRKSRLASVGMTGGCLLFQRIVGHSLGTLKNNAEALRTQRCARFSMLDLGGGLGV